MSAELTREQVERVMSDFLRHERICNGHGWEVPDPFEKSTRHYVYDGDELKKPAVFTAILDELERRGLSPIIWVAEINPSGYIFKMLYRGELIISQIAAPTRYIAAFRAALAVLDRDALLERAKEKCACCGQPMGAVGYASNDGTVCPKCHFGWPPHQTMGQTARENLTARQEGLVCSPPYDDALALNAGLMSARLDELDAEIFALKSAAQSLGDRAVNAGRAAQSIRHGLTALKAKQKKPSTL